MCKRFAKQSVQKNVQRQLSMQAGLTILLLAVMQGLSAHDPCRPEPIYSCDRKTHPEQIEKANHCAVHPAAQSTKT
jgi:hypothetical protein